MRTILVCLCAVMAVAAARADVHFGNGIKIGEVDSTSANVWLRLIDATERRTDGTSFKDGDEKVPDGLTLRDMKDDHNTLMNDCWPGQKYGDLTWEQGLAIFREQFPMGEKPYRTVRWGKDVQVWMTEGRDFRSPNNMPDGPEKSILGADQKKWLFDTMRASDAAFRILISSTPIVGPDRGNKNDSHANKGFTHEGEEIRAFLATLPGTYVFCGDRHWQYVSRHGTTGGQGFPSAITMSSARSSTRKPFPSPQTES